MHQRSYPIWPYGHVKGYALLWPFTLMSKVIFHDDISQSCQRLCSMMTFQSCQRLCSMMTFHSHVKGYIPWWPFTIMSKVMFHDDLSQSCQRLCSMMTFQSCQRLYSMMTFYKHVKCSSNITFCVCHRLYTIFRVDTVQPFVIQYYSEPKVLLQT